MAFYHGDERPPPAARQTDVRQGLSAHSSAASQNIDETFTDLQISHMCRSNKTFLFVCFKYSSNKFGNDTFQYSTSNGEPFVESVAPEGFE